jgi:phosphatidylglycerophosphatase A
MTKSNVARAIATWFGCGLFPYGPGTVGSAGALAPVLIAMRYFDVEGWECAAVGAALFVPGVWASEVTARDAQQKDPGFIVVDEVVGQLIALGGATRLNAKSLAMALILFRLFDIWKPYPIRRLEKFPGGLGIVADDALAGIYAALVLFMMGWLNLY